LSHQVPPARARPGLTALLSAQGVLRGQVPSI